VTSERITSAVPSAEEEAVERAIRPRRLEEYIGQAPVKEQLEIFVSAARARAEALDHVLIFGPPGLGPKTIRAACEGTCGRPASRGTDGHLFGAKARFCRDPTPLRQGNYTARRTVTSGWDQWPQACDATICRKPAGPPI